MTYKVTNFDGAVLTKNGISLADGRVWHGFSGKVSILDATEVVGFEIRDKDSNWIARVDSRDGKRSVNIPGCQVQAILQGKFDKGTFYYEV